MGMEKERLPLEGVKSLIQMREGEFIIHVEFGKGAGGCGEREWAARSSVDPFSEGCNCPVRA